MCILSYGHEHSTAELYICSDREIKNKAWQVMELEEFRNNLLQENQRLMEITSGLQSQIQNLERSISSTSSSDELKKVCLYLLGRHILYLLA